MIRQDYFVRMVQRLAQALAQALVHKNRHEYDRAEQELNDVLAQCFELGTEIPDLEQLLAECATEGGAESVLRLADVLALRGEVQRLQGKEKEASNDEALALGLYLQVLQTSVVSIELIQKAGQLVERTSASRLPAAVLKRLLAYYEARGLLAQAEDALYDWLDTKDPLAPEGGLQFYHRLARHSDEDLSRGGLTRGEIEQGILDWRRKTGQF